MTFKEWNAAVMVASSVLVSAWLAWRLSVNGLAPDMSAAAWQVLWAFGWLIVFNMVAMIVLAIVIGIVRREELKDEQADERDRLVSARAMRNGYFALSVGVVLVVGAQAFGTTAETVPYLLYAISALAGGVFAASQLIYYRLG